MDLLLHLIKRNELDIHRVSLHMVISQYLETIQQMRRLDIDIAGEFLTTAAQLMLIKSTALLQRQRSAHSSNELDTSNEDNAPASPEESELLSQLEEYQRVKEAAAALAELERLQATLFPFSPAPEVNSSDPVYLGELSQLTQAFEALLQRLKITSPGQSLATIEQESYPIEEQIDSIRSTLSDQQAHTFDSLFQPGSSRAKLIATFLAILELMKTGVLHVIQKTPFTAISLQFSGPLS